MLQPLSLHDCHYSCTRRSVLVDSLQRSAPLVTSPIPIPISTHVLVFSRICKRPRCQDFGVDVALYLYRKSTFKLRLLGTLITRLQLAVYYYTLAIILTDEVKKQPNENEDRLRKYLRPAAVLHTTHTHMHKLEMVAGLTNRSPAR
ncbi:unnamed protein product [Fusarium graminearum]|uniref:Uncharacterized protein n=1 Tax=Gibberella zeae TaxID=5518 RepID=A0A4E9ELN6_GIBZA|nr:unnamed protein product [Fusarium graminearum]CAG1966735.1 unnamed protein product [Fusarium graminearum]